MKVICSKEECIGCLNCYNVCKFGAIEVLKDDLDFIYAQVDGDKCVGCGACKWKCPILQKYNTERELINECYASVNKDEEICSKSSSGGMFYELAKVVLDKEGVVYGAAFDSKFNVIHKRIDKLENIKSLMGSKYVQSDIGNIYGEVKKDLENELQVLFTGTPCQIAALNIYLGKQYDNLYLQDFICHGVGSKKILDKHISEIKQSYKLKNIKQMNFRDKISGWKNFSFSIYTKEGNYAEDLTKDNFMKTFLKNLSLRTSCYTCNYKGNKRQSDITLADFWGIEKVLPNFDAKNGVSAVILNTAKGKSLFENIKDKIVYEKVDFADISKNNICLENPPIYNRHRQDFIKDINEGIELSEIKEEYYTR